MLLLHRDVSSNLMQRGPRKITAKRTGVVESFSALVTK